MACAFVRWVGLLAVLSAANVAQAGPEQEIARARRLVNEELRFEKAIPVLEKVLLDSKITSSERIEAYLLLGIAHVARGREDSAEAAFVALLNLEPGYRIDPMLSPKIRTIFDRVREKRNRDPRILGMSARFDQDRIRVAGELHDPDQRVERVLLYSRFEGREYARTTMKRSALSTTGQLPVSAQIQPPAASGKLRLEYYVVAERADDVLARLGGPESPSSFVIERPLPGLTPTSTVKITEPESDSIVEEWWFWALVVGAASAGVVTAVAVSSGGTTAPSGTLPVIVLD